jgi:hypothetical protein
MTSRVVARTTGLVAGVAFVISGAASANAAAPTATDFGTCNMVAAEKVVADTPSASPRVDRPDRANDPAYVAAYQACMRERGF